jgi:general secretion pathway protein C
MNSPRRLGSFSLKLHRLACILQAVLVGRVAAFLHLSLPRATEGGMVTLDALFKRYHPFVICLFIASAAYFQASGLSSLVAATLDHDMGDLSPSTPLTPATVDEREPVRSAAPILARNPFDSITGALDVEPIVMAPLSPDASGDPYLAPSCEIASVVLIAGSDDPDWSFAAIGGPRGTRLLLRRGDELAGHRVEHIGWDRVWMIHGTTRCQMVLGTRQKTAPPPKPALRPPAPRPPARAAGRAAVPPEIASKIQKLSDHQFRLDRYALNLILERQSELFRSVRIVPDKSGGEAVGFRLLQVASGSLFDMLGLKNGDRIRSINGMPLADPQRALEAYARLRSADHLTVGLQRGGKDMTIDLHIQ